MEKIFYVRNGDLSEVNNELKKGGKIKMIQAVSGVVCSPAIGRGDAYAYIVVDMADKN